MLRVLLVLLATAVPTLVSADAVRLKPDHPARYTVTKGDTLSSIAARFLENSADWRRIWKDDAKDLNQIYPGDVVVLTDANGKPELSLLRKEKRPVAERAATAEPAVAGADDFAAVKAKLHAVFPGVVLTTLRRSTIPGWYEFEDGMQLVYVSADGKHLFLGDVIDIGTRTNLTASWREQTVRRLLDGVGEQNMIVIGPAKAKRTITVFTDVDCSYCQKLHLDVPELNKNGVKVRYLLFPRGGIGSENYRRSVAVWCAADRVKAVGAAKAGGEIEMKTCASPVENNYRLGQQIGVTGTPAIFLDDGKQIGGYVPVARLLAILNLAPLQQSKNAR